MNFSEESPCCYQYNNNNNNNNNNTKNSVNNNNSNNNNKLERSISKIPKYVRRWSDNAGIEDPRSAQPLSPPKLKLKNKINNENENKNVSNFHGNGVESVKDISDNSNYDINILNSREKEGRGEEKEEDRVSTSSTYSNIIETASVFDADTFSVPESYLTDSEGFPLLKNCDSFGDYFNGNSDSSDEDEKNEKEEENGGNGGDREKKGVRVCDGKINEVEKNVSQNIVENNCKYQLAHSVTEKEEKKKKKKQEKKENEMTENSQSKQMIGKKINNCYNDNMDDNNDNNYESSSSNKKIKNNELLMSIERNKIKIQNEINKIQEEKNQILTKKEVEQGSDDDSALLLDPCNNFSNPYSAQFRILPKNQDVKEYEGRIEKVENNNERVRKGEGRRGRSERGGERGGENGGSEGDDNKVVNAQLSDFCNTEIQGIIKGRKERKHDKKRGSGRENSDREGGRREGESDRGRERREGGRRRKGKGEESNNKERKRGEKCKKGSVSTSSDDTYDSIEERYMSCAFDYEHVGWQVQEISDRDYWNKVSWQNNCENNNEYNHRNISIMGNEEEIKDERKKDKNNGGDTLMNEKLNKREEMMKKIILDDFDDDDDCDENDNNNGYDNNDNNDNGNGKSDNDDCVMSMRGEKIVGEKEVDIVRCSIKVNERGHENTSCNKNENIKLTINATCNNNENKNKMKHKSKCNNKTVIQNEIQNTPEKEKTIFKDNKNSNKTVSEYKNKSEYETEDDCDNEYENEIFIDKNLISKLENEIMSENLEKNHANNIKYIINENNDNDKNPNLNSHNYNNNNSNSNSKKINDQNDYYFDGNTVNFVQEKETFSNFQKTESIKRKSIINNFREKQK